jgi:hypothetical protein
VDVGAALQAGVAVGMRLQNPHIKNAWLNIKTAKHSNKRQMN